MISTAIPYANGAPHIGHAYERIATDGIKVAASAATKVDPQARTVGDAVIGGSVNIERPLRMRFEATDAGIAAFNEATSDTYAEALATVRGDFDRVEALLKAAGIKKMTKAHFKELMSNVGIKDPDAQPMKDEKGNVMADPDLRENENVPLNQDIHEYFAKKVLPHVPDAWIDESKKDEKDGKVGIVGYEINFNRYFYQYQPPRALSAIDADLKAIEAEIADLLGEVTE